MNFALPIRSEMCNVLDGMFLAETQSRNYNIKPKLHKLSSNDQVINRYIEAIKNNSGMELHQLLNSYPDACDNEGLSPLKIAILCSNIDMVKTILNYDITDNGILSFACENNYDNMNDEIVFELLNDSRFDVNIKGGTCNEIPLYYAINKDKELDIVKLLLDNESTNINLTFNGWKSILQYCIFNKKYDVCSLLLKHTKLVLLDSDFKVIFTECPGEIINTLLQSPHLANCGINLNEYFISLINRFDTSFTSFSILTKYIDINYRDLYGKTPLMYCVDTEDINKLTHILSMPNLDVSLTDNYGMNVLMYAIVKKHYIYAKLLIDNIKSDDKCERIINQQNKIKETPILMASKKNDVALFNLICEIDCVNVNCTDVLGYSPLHHAIKTDSYDIFELLVNHKNIDVNMQDLEGMSPLFHAIDTYNDKITYTLLNNKNINVNVTNNNGQNIFNYILQKKYDKPTNEKSDIVTGSVGMIGFESSEDLAQYPLCFSQRPIIANDNNKNFSMNYSPLTFGDKVTIDSDKQTKLINSVIEKGVDLNNFDINDLSGLMYVINNSDRETFNLLLNSENLNINAQNSTGQTYLMYLFEKINVDAHNDFDQKGSLKSSKSDNFMYEAVNMTSNSFSKPNRCFPKSSTTNSNIYLTFFMQLLSHPKLDINLPNYLDNTILSLVSATSNTNLLTKIIKHKDINVNMTNYKGMSAFTAATLNHLWNNVKILLVNGADNEQKDNKGKKACDYLDEANLFIYRKIVSQYFDDKIKELRNERTITEPEQKSELEQSLQEDNSFTVKRGWLF